SRFRSSSYAAHIAHSFPTRRSSDLEALCPQRARREGLAQLLRRGEHRFRPAAVDERSGFGRRQGALEVEQAVLVLRTDLDLVPVAGQHVQEGHGGSPPPSVEEPPFRPCRDRKSVV